MASSNMMSSRHPPLADDCSPRKTPSSSSLFRDSLSVRPGREAGRSLAFRTERAGNQLVLPWTSRPVKHAGRRSRVEPGIMKEVRQGRREGGRTPLPWDRPRPRARREPIPSAPILQGRPEGPSRSVDLTPFRCDTTKVDLLARGAGTLIDASSRVDQLADLHHLAQRGRRPGHGDQAGAQADINPLKKAGWHEPRCRFRRQGSRRQVRYLGCRHPTTIRSIQR